MRTRLAVGCVLILAAAAPGFAQDWYEPNPSLARLSADDAYARTSARSLRTAGIGAAVAIRLDDAGRVLVADVSRDAPRIVRLDAEGRFDPTFGTAGVAEVPVLSGGALDLEIDAAGRIVVTGSFHEAGSYPWEPYAGPVYGAARLLADGSLDPAFSGDGLLELDVATGIHGLGAVRASGGDGAMLAVAEKPGPYYYPLVGIVRITADGTIDATYGGGFAQIARYPQFPPFVPTTEYVQVADFAVDAVGRAVVAVRDLYGSGTRSVQRLDATGAFDPSFWITGWGSTFAASQVALDGAGRIVGLESARLSRRLPDGAPDKTFAGDGSAWNQAAHVVGLSWDQMAHLCYRESLDPDYAGDSLCEAGLLAVATRADSWALAKLVEYHNATGRVVARGIEVRAIDPADPGAIVSTTYRSPDRNFSRLAGLAVAPDGSTAYALGNAFVLRVDLASPKPLPLPDLRVQWLGYPRAVDLGGGRYLVSALVRIRNVSRRDAEQTIGLVGFGDGKFDVSLVPFRNSPSPNPFRVRARSSVVRRFTWEGGDSSTNLAGVRLGIQVSCELPDANFADNTATSLPITPVYAPR